jgi:hypothetical protein
MPDVTLGTWRPPTTQLVGPPQVTELLDIGIKAAFRLIRTGLAGPLYRFVQYEMVEREQLEALADPETWPVWNLDDLPPAFVARVGPPDESDAEDFEGPPGEDGDRPRWQRSWKGWHKNAPRDAQLAGVSRWWEVREPEQLSGRLFVATVSGFTVEVARIKRARPSGVDTTWAFDLTDPPEADSEADAWRNIRTKQPPGGPRLRHRLD